MSVVNQMLSQLEQRGAHPVLKQDMVRAVPHGKRRFTVPMPLLTLGLASGLALAAGFAAWHWIQIRKPALSSVEGPKAVAVSAIQRQPAVAIPAPASSIPSVAAVTATAASAATAEAAPPAETLPPDLRLSLELGTAPQPSTISPSGKAQDRFRSGQASRGVKNSPAPDKAERTEPANAAPSARLAAPQSIQTVLPNARAAVQPSSGASPMKQTSPAQHADAEFRKSVVLMQQGHTADAIAGYEAALRLDARHDEARQALVALLLEGKRGADAESVLQEGLKNKPEHTGFAMLLARLQVERGAVGQAAATLEKTLPYADRQADYQAFFAALLQRQDRHGEAITHYRIALQLAPDNGVWLMGYGISLQATQHNDDARDAFRRALESKTLNSELQKFVQQRLREL